MYIISALVIHTLIHVFSTKNYTYLWCPSRQPVFIKLAPVQECNLKLLFKKKKKVWQCIIMACWSTQ